MVTDDDDENKYVLVMGGRGGRKVGGKERIGLTSPIVRESDSQFP